MDELEKPSETIFLADDEPEIRSELGRLLSEAGHPCRLFPDGAELLEAVKLERPALIVTDFKMPKVDGLDLLRRVREAGLPVPVVLVTSLAAVDLVVTVIKEGAADYVTKPYSNDQLLHVVDRALREGRLRRENMNLKDQLSSLTGLDRLAGTSPAMQEVMNMVRKVAPTVAGVLIQGESGTGKELVARCLHLNSRRSGGPFVPVDCASLPENLLEAELFGHEKGAFTDAHASKEGLVESADGGTLFLDEIGDMPALLQSKLLRVLQERQIRRLGSNRLIPVDIRVVAATHRPLEKMVAEGKFREDLFYRLNVIQLTLPPLRERAGDVPLLAMKFLKEFGKVNGKVLEGIDPAALRLLEAYAWPGNVRELRNAIERAVTMTEGPRLIPTDLPPSLRTPLDRI